MNAIDQILSELTARLSVSLNRDIRSITYQSIHGGSINQVYRLKLDDGPVVCCKVNQLATFPGMFLAESSGLALIRATAALRVPAVIGCWEIAGWQVLVMEWIETKSPTRIFWEDFGKQLAALHTHSTNGFGLDSDNYMGALPQSNKKQVLWSAFFYRQRIEPQVKIALDKGLITITQAKRFEALEKSLPDIFPDTAPSLLHGDLWSGNFLCSSSGEAVLIDPAVYYGERSVDLAMTTLFGGFDKVFYESYHYHHPLPANYELQWACCNLYPLLIHLNLFGSSYLGRILDTLRRF